MSLPYTFLTLAAASGLWWAGHALSCSRETLQAVAPPPAFALAGSAYGILAAHLIRDSLYSYWHGGESAAPPAGTQASQGVPPPPTPVRFARKGMPPSVASPQIQADVSWLQTRVDHLTRLEKSRTKRSSTLPLSNAHQQYLNAAADVRLRFAYHLDPGDATLYEILHFQLTSRTPSQENARVAIEVLAQRALAHGLREDGSLSDALTGAGAAINLLNDQLRPGNQRRDNKAIINQWHDLEHCLDRYRHLRSDAQTAGWWDRIPAVRRQELEEHAKLLTRISEMIRPVLPPGAIPSNQLLLPTPSGSR